MRQLLIVAAVGLAAAVSSPSAVYASCARPPGQGSATLAAQIDAAPIAFVGTVVGTTNGDRVARVMVESIWKGPVIPSLVTVSGTPDQGATATSVDRTFQVGQRYLFLPFTASSPIQDNSCSATQVYSAELDALKPAAAQPPGPGSDGPDPTTWPLVAWIGPGIAGLLAAGFATWILARRRGQARPKALDPQ